MNTHDLDSKILGIFLRNLISDFLLLTSDFLLRSRKEISGTSGGSDLRWMQGATSKV